MGILNPLSRHAKLFGSGVYFVEKATNNGFLLSIQTLSILILSKVYPTMGILSPLSRHVKLFGSGVYFAEKATNNGSLLSNFSLGLV